MSIQNGPVPSRLTLLSDLPKFPPASKVRFLGCVTKYSHREATLTLEHNYPPGASLRVQVDIRLLLETIQSTQCQIGSWVNVIGYIESAPNKTIPTTSKAGSIYVQGIILWSTGPSKIDWYEKALEIVSGLKDNER
ncbi:hypothetical protein HI914_03514 [Erysiphe necator]|nr:hypothetical protein HI914_03514 [Erysiphe necator]